MFWTRNDKKLNTKLMKEIPSPSIYLQNTYNTYHITNDDLATIIGIVTTAALLILIIMGYKII